MRRRPELSFAAIGAGSSPRRSLICQAAIVCLAMLLFAMNASATAYFSVSSGAWNTANRWNKNVGCGNPGNNLVTEYPGSAAGDTATICSNAATAITLPLSPANALTSLTIGSGVCTNATSLASSTGAVALTTASLNVACANSTLSFNGVSGVFTLTVNGDINNSGTISVSANARTHVLNVSGKITNNNIIDLFTAAGQICNLTFTGGTTHTLDGSGATTEFNNLTVNNNFIVNMGASGTTITQTGTMTVNGTLKVQGGTYNLTNLVSVTDTTTIGGSAAVTATLAITGVTSTKTFSGLFTVNAFGAWSNATAENPTFSLGVDINNDGSGNNGTFSTSSTSANTITAGGLTNDGIFNSSSSGLFTISGGGLTNTGSFTSSGMSNFTFNTAAQDIVCSDTHPISIATITVNVVTVTNKCDATPAVPAAVTLTVRTALSGSGGLTQDTNASLIIGGTSGITTLTAGATDNTVTYNLAGAQTVKLPAGGNYFNLTLSGSGNKTSVTGTYNILGDMLVNSGPTWVGTGGAPDPAVNITGNLKIDGSFTTGNGAYTLKGDFENNGTFTHTAAGTFTMNGTTAGQTIKGTTAATFVSLTISNTFVDGLPATVDGVAATTNFNVGTTLTVSASALLSPAAGVVINTAGAAGTITGSGTIEVTRILATADYVNQYKFLTNTLSGLTVKYSGAGTQTINASATVGTYGSLIASTSGTKTLGGAVTVNTNGTLAVNTSGVVLDMSTFTADCSGNGTLTVVSGATLKIGGANPFPANYTTVTLTGSTVEYSGTSQNVLGQTYGNLTLSGAATSTKTLVTANATVNGNLSVNATGTTFDLAALTANGTGTLLVVGGATLKIGGTNSFPTGYGTVTLQASSTVEYAGAAQDVLGRTYANLTLSGAAVSTKTLVTGNATVNGNLSVNATGTTFDLAALTANGTGTLLVVGGATLKIGGTNSFPTGYGTVTLQASSTVEYAGAAQDVLGRTYANLTLSGAAVSTKTLVTANATVNGNLSVNATGTTFDLQNLTANGTGTLLVVTGATLKIGTTGGTNGFPSGYGTNTLQSASTVEYAGDAQTVANQSYSNLTLSGNGAKTLLAGMTTIGNIFTITAGATATAVVGLTVTGNFVLSTTTANAFDAGSFTHQFGGNFTDTSTGSPSGFKASTSTVNFNGGALQTISGSANTTFNNLQISNATSLSGGVTTTVVGTLTLNSGTFSVGANSLVLNGAIAGTTTNLSTTSSSNLTLGGIVNVTLPSSGVTALNNFTVNKTAGSVTLGVNLPISGDLSVSASGGTLDLATFTANHVGAGGTLTVANGATLRIGGTNGFPTNYNTAVSLGGTSTVEYYGTNQAIGNYDYGNLLLNNSGTGTSGGTTTVSGSLTINSGVYDLGSNSLTASGGSATLTLAGTATLKIGGTNGFPTGFSTVTLGNTTTVEYYGSAQTVGGQNYGHLTLSGSGTKTLGGTATVKGNLTSTTSGVTFDLGMNTCAASGGSATITIGDGVTLKIGGTNTFPSGYATTTLGASSSTVEYNGSAQNVAALGYANLTVSGSGTKTLAGSASVSATLTLSNGLISTGASQLSIGAAGSVSRCASLTECFVVGNLVRGVATGSPTLTWDIGVIAPSAAYTPVTLALTTVSVAGTVLVTTTNGDHASIGTSQLDSSKSVNRYWTVTNSGVTYVSVDSTFGFAAADLDGGVTTANLAVGKFSSGDWSYPDVGTAGATSTQAVSIQFGDGFGDFEVAEVSTTANPLSLWHMDQQAWSGAPNEVQDGGSGGYHGAADGLSGSKPMTALSTPAIAGNPGTCSYGAFTRASKHYVALPTGFPNLGTSGSFTVMAWVRTTDNTQSGQRIFEDDQNNTQGYALSLGDPGTGRLRFFSRGTSTVSLDDTTVLASNQWYFVAAIADVTLKRKRIYVYNPAGAGTWTSSTQTWTTTFGSGDAGPPSIGGETNAASSSENTSAYGFSGNIDEVRVYQIVLGKAHLDRIRQLTQPCLSLNHFAFSHDGSAVNCQAEPITIGAHVPDHSPFISYANTVTLSTSTGRGDWSAVDANGTLNNGTANDGIATYTFVPADSGDIVLGLKDTYVETVNLHAVDGAITENSGTATAGEDQSLAYAQTGFNFLADGVADAIGTQIAGKASDVAPGVQALKVQAIKTSDSTGACETALNTATTIQMKLACIDPASCSSPVSITGMSTVSVPTSYTSVALNFASGLAPFTLNYPDAGKIRLDAQYDIPHAGGSSGNLMQGSSNTFLVKPAGLCVESTDTNADCPSGDATCTVFKAAGATFNLTVKAVGWGGAVETNTALCDNTVTQNFQLNSIALTSTLVAPSGGTNATLGVSSVNVTTGGTQTAASETVSEVGVLKITATPPAYFGQTIAASTSANIGRFVPDRFTVTANTPVFAHACTGGSEDFTYMDQPFYYGTAPVLTVTALNEAGGTTLNYGDTFWKLKKPPLASPLLSGRTFTDQSGHAAQFPTPVNGSDDAALGGDTDLVDGQGTLTLTAGNVSGADKFTYQRAAAPGAPFNADIDMLVPAVDLTDDDNVCYDSDNNGSCDTFTIAGITGSGSGTKQQRYGRLVLGTAAGSELLPLSVPMQTEYFDGTAFVVNSDDSCTAIAPNPNLTLSSSVESGQTDATVDVSDAFGCASGISTATDNNPLSGGLGGLSLSAPGAQCTGKVEITTDLNALGMGWLRYNWVGGGGPDENPTGEAVFGVFRGHNELIYQREPWN